MDGGNVGMMKRKKGKREIDYTCTSQLYVVMYGINLKLREQRRSIYPSQQFSQTNNLKKETRIMSMSDGKKKMKKFIFQRHQCHCFLNLSSASLSQHLLNYLMY